jgi:hypothetical protein
MKTILVIVLLFTLEASAQTVPLAGPKTLTGSSSNLVVANWDTVAAAIRAVVRSGLKYTQAQLDSALAAKVCPPGFTQAQLDSAFQAGKASVPLFPDSVCLSTGTSTRTYKP